MSKTNKQIQDEYLFAYEENSDALFRFVYFRTHDREDARDIVQETFLKTWRYLADGEQIDQLRPFLYRTAKNLLIDMTKQKKTRNTHSLDEYMDAGGEIAAESERSEFDPFDIKRAMKLLNNLEPDEYREAIQLRFIDELSIAEIAHIAGVSENVISVRINRGINKLKKLFPI